MNSHIIDKIPKGLLLIIAVAATAIGFNTLDAMINAFAWAGPWEGPWYMNTWFAWEWWNCYAVFGIISFCIGLILTGWLAGKVE
jgi:hypothetical protein